MSIAIVAPPRQEAEVIVGTQAVAAGLEGTCCPTARRDLVDVGGGQLMYRPVPDVGNLQAGFFSQAALHCHVPLERVGSPGGSVESAIGRGYGRGELICGE